MAACQMLDFGAMPSSTERHKTLEPDPQGIQSTNLNRILTQQSAEPRERSKTSPLFEVADQIGKILMLPFSALAVATQIESLPTSEDIEVRPTSYAHLQAKRLVIAAYVSMYSNKLEKPAHVPPRPIIGTDDVGGILISWTLGNKYFAAKFGAQPESRSFVYFEQGGLHQAVDLSEQNLFEKLKWLSA